MAQKIINNGESGLVVRNKLNENFTETYETTTNITDDYIPIKDGVEFQDSPIRYDSGQDILISSKSIQTPDAVVSSVQGKTGDVVLDVAEEILLYASHPTDQTPLGQDLPLQILFGAAQNTLLDPVQIDALGNITFNEAGQYLADLYLQYGRTGSGGVSWLFYRVLIDGVQHRESHPIMLDDSNSDVLTQVSIPLDLAQGSVVTLEVYRDSIGNNQGGLVSEVPSLTPDWLDAPSSRIVISRSKVI